MQFTRHARNGIRKLRMTAEQVEAIVASPVAEDRDPAGNRRLFGHHGDVIVRVVIAADEPEKVISVHQRRRLP